MAKPKVTTEIGSEAKLLKYGDNVLKKSTENAVLFPDATELVAALKTELDLFRNSVAEASYRDKRQVVIKNQNGTALRQALYQLSLHVEMVAKGDPNLILAAGFTPSKPRSIPVGISPKPTILSVRNHEQGLMMVDLSTKAWRSARYYQFEHRIVGAVDWTVTLSSKSRITLKELDHLKEYEFRVSYLGPDPTPNYSDNVRCFVV